MWRLISRVWQRFYGFTHAVNQSYTISTLSYAPVVLSKNLARILKQLIINFTMSLDWDRPNTHAQMKPRCSPNRYLGSRRMLLSFSCVLCCFQSQCGRRRRGDWWVEPRAWWREPSLLAPAICSYPRTPLHWPPPKVYLCMVCRQGSGKVDFAFAWFPIVLATSVTQIGAPDHAPHLPVLPPALHMLSRAIYSSTHVGPTSMSRRSSFPTSSSPAWSGGRHRRHGALLPLCPCGCCAGATATPRHREMQRRGGGVIEMVQQQLRSTRARVGMVWAGLKMGTRTGRTCRTVLCNSQKEKLKLIVCLL